MVFYSVFIYCDKDMVSYLVLVSVFPSRVNKNYFSLNVYKEHPLY